TLTLCTQRKRGGEMVGCEPSRFLEEFPEDHLNWVGRAGQEEDPEVRKDRDRSRLAALKGLLNNG
ncbi:MAG: hypothetical protein ACQERR_08200, partial [Pseudomonadota bacterium]